MAKLVVFTVALTFDAGWGSALRSIADRVLPNPEIAMWAPAAARGALDR